MSMLGKRKLRNSANKRYLLWTHRKLFDINNGTDKIESSKDNFPQKIGKK